MGGEVVWLWNSYWSTWVSQHVLNLAGVVFFIYLRHSYADHLNTCWKKIELITKCWLILLTREACIRHRYNEWIRFSNSSPCSYIQNWKEGEKKWLESVFDYLKWEKGKKKYSRFSQVLIHREWMEKSIGEKTFENMHLFYFYFFSWSQKNCLR